MSETIKIFGGNPLSGTVTPVPNKNSILSALPACILSDKPVIYHNVPKSTDVIKMLEMLRLLGAEIDDTDFAKIKIDCKKIKSYIVDKELGNLIRASLMFAGPLLARFGVAEIPVPGGCVLGERSIAAHIDVFQKSGIIAEYFDGYLRLKAPKKPAKSYDIWQFEASVTATENFALYAAGVDCEFSLTDAACEPHVTALLHLLSDMGAKISGFDSNKIYIKGTKTPKTAHFYPKPDFVDIAGLCVAAAVTKGKITIKGANINEIVGGLKESFEKFGIQIKSKGEDLVVNGSVELKIDTKNSGFPMAGDTIPKLAPRPWPGFPVDALPAMVTLACKTNGTTLVNNWMYETGLDFIRELNAMGANIFMCDPQRVLVYGPVNFRGGRIVSPSIIQACKAIFLASLADPVETTITGSEVLKRRYPDIYRVYCSLGADIKLVS